MQKVASKIILIPSFNPDQKLVTVVSSLIEQGLHVVVVNDGSDPSYNTFFEEAASAGATILLHAKNLGKGRALKTGFNFILTNYPTAVGCVTADADGQHAVQDIIRVAHQLSSEDSFVMGNRTFTHNVPLRSWLGNILTRNLFKLLVGLKLKDTQSGLRGIGKNPMMIFLSLPGERYEFETNMLIECRNQRIGVSEVEISTIYIDNNKSSHFNPIRDSMRIYFLLFRFALSSILTSIIDLTAFYISYKATEDLVTSLVIGRVLAGSFNFMTNRNLVFKSTQKGLSRAFLEYCLVVLIFAGLSIAMVELLVEQLAIGVVAAKVISETILFFGSFSIQRDYVFRPRPQ